MVCASFAEMTFEELVGAVRARRRPEVEVSAPVIALWQDACGDWEGAHATVQHETKGGGAWVHAYLHRKEGDLGNAGYWYRRAGRPEVGAEITIADEWEIIAKALLG